MLLSKGIKSSIQRELDSFYKEVCDRDFNVREVTKGAFTQARAKLKPEVFVELNDNVNETFYNEAPYIQWNGRRVLACDGTRLMLPRHESVIEEFGEHGFGPNADTMQSLATASVLYDPLNLLTLDAKIASLSTGERDLLHQHLEKVKPGDLLLLDRGYPSIALMYLLKAKGIDFCMRMKDDWWKEVKQFVKSGKKEKIVRFNLPQKDRELLKDYPQMIDTEIQCRLVCVKLENGEKEILCTSLLDKTEIAHDNFKELYHFRWGVEEGYKLFKSRVEIENFSGKTAWAVKQDFYAKIFMMSLSAVLAFPIEEKVRKESAEDPNKKYEQKINRTQAYSTTSSISIGLFLKNLVKPALKAFDEIVRRTTEIIRPGRKFPRNKKVKRPYYMNYKRL